MTPKSPGVYTASATCGVSGGLDEAAKAAWIKALAAKGATASVDGGTISLTINPDGTGVISPTVQYQCHTKDAANEMQR